MSNNFNVADSLVLTSTPSSVSPSLLTSLHLDYFPSGLTPPTTNIVTRKFMMTRHEGPYPVRCNNARCIFRDQVEQM